MPGPVGQSARGDEPVISIDRSSMPTHTPRRWPQRLWGPCAVLAAVLLPLVALGYSGDSGYEAALRATPDLVHGAGIFTAQCAGCHGGDGRGSDNGLVPLIAAQHAAVILRQLYNYRQDRRWDLRMEHVTDGHVPLGPQEMADVAGYIAGMPPAAGHGVGSGEYAAHGGSLYRQTCAGCHGRLGEGSSAARVPRLAGQSYAYLLRQLHDVLEHRRPDFPSGHIAVLRPLIRDDLDGVADYLSRLAPAGSTLEVDGLPDGAPAGR